MISKRVHGLFLLSAVLFIAHGVEEHLTGLYNFDSIFKFLSPVLRSMSVPQATFISFQIATCILLIISYLLIFKKGSAMYLLMIPASVAVIEVHHLIKAAIRGGYYSGSMTALLLVIVGVFFWKELIMMYKADARSKIRR